MNLLFALTILSASVVCDIYGFRMDGKAFKLYGNRGKGPDNADFNLAQAICIESGGELLNVSKVNESILNYISDELPFDLALVQKDGACYVLMKHTHVIRGYLEDRVVPFLCQMPDGL